MAPAAVEEQAEPPRFWPEWLEESLHVTPGRDPLGLQTITLDRITPSLVPGVLALSRRARYFSIYPYLLSYYEEHELAPNLQALSDFIRTWEYEYAVSVMLCPRGCGEAATSVVGSQRARPAASSLGDELARELSVESSLGGYGLYYGAPLESFGVVARRGTLLGDEPIPIDVLARNGRGQALAEVFGQAIEPTTYFRDYMGGGDPIPREVLVELSTRCCLCRLDDFDDERELLRELLFEEHDSVPAEEVHQRQVSFAVLLDAIERHPEASANDGALFETALSRFEDVATGASPLDGAYQQWCALGLKEYVQDGLSSVWSQFVRDGFRLQPEAGYARDEIRELIRTELAASGTLQLDPIELDWSPETPTTEVEEFVGELPQTLGWEVLKERCNEEDSAISGLVLMLAVVGQAPEVPTAPNAWMAVATQGTDRQPSLAQFLEMFRAHLDEEPTVADSLEWLVARRVIAPHEAIAYSKLPEFTFRFRWESGRLAFFNLGLERFNRGDPRRRAMAQISNDLGLWNSDGGEARVTSAGQGLIDRVGEAS
ncbi:MAG: hypothetical protein U0R51_01615 [Solirubrobacterales bacterium]